MTRSADGSGARTVDFRTELAFVGEQSFTVTPAGA